MDAVHATAETLQATLEHMQVVEEMRRTLREIRGANKLDSNWGVARTTQPRCSGRETDFDPESFKRKAALRWLRRSKPAPESSELV
jgi:hypothetical protein